MKLKLLLSAAAILLAASSTLAATYTSTTVEQRNITYKGGPVLTGQVNVYFVFYGNWSKEESESTYNILMDFTDNISQSGWFSTLQYFTDSNGQGVTGPLKTAAALIDNFSQHQDLMQNSSDSTIPEFQLDGNDAHIKIIEDATSNTAHLGDAVDSHGIYVVFTSEEVSMDGFCQDWCGYNSWTDKYAYVVIGHPSRCPDGCVPPLNKNNSPNGNTYADAMVNTFAHELIDVLTDPIGNAYRVSESDTEEVADFCMPPTASSDEWWGTDLKQTGSGAYYNVALGENGVYKYLIQSIWSPKESKCVMGGSSV